MFRGATVSPGGVTPTGSSLETEAEEERETEGTGSETEEGTED